MKRLGYCSLIVLFPFLSAAQGTVQIPSGTQVVSSNSTYLVLDNLHLQNNGSLVQSAGSGTVKFTGSSDVNLSGSGTTTLDGLMLSLTGSTKLNLQKNMAVVSSLTFNGGLLNLGTSVVNLGSTGLLQNESEASRAYTTGTGYLQFTTTLNAPSSANPGNLGAVITSASNLGSTVIRRGHQSQMNSFSNGSTILRYYDISPTNNTALNATLRINYFDAELNGLNEGSLSMWRSPNNINWSNIGFDTRSTASNYVEKTGIASFSRWTLSTTANPLPLTYGMLNSTCLNNTVRLNWNTVFEQGIRRFDIERSTSQAVWIVAGSLAAIGNGSNSYSFTHASVTTGAVYRIVAYDVDGKKTYSTILRSPCHSNAGFDVYPNPVKRDLTVSLYGVAAGPLQLSLYDAKASLVMTRSYVLTTGNTMLQLPMTGLPPGTYTLMATWSGRSETLRIIKE